MKRSRIISIFISVSWFSFWHANAYSVDSIPQQKYTKAQTKKTQPRPAACQIYNHDEQLSGIKLWGGAEFIHVFGNFASYVPAFMSGYVVGMSVPFKHLDLKNDAYISFVSDFANTAQNVSVNSQAIDSVYYMLNFQLLFGLEHYISGRTWSIYGDIGPVFAQRSLIVTEISTSTVNNYYIYTSFDLGANFGLSYIYKYSDKLSFIAKTNLNAIVGIPRSDSIVANGVVIDSVNSNAMMLIPSISIGVKF